MRHYILIGILLSLMACGAKKQVVKKHKQVRVIAVMDSQIQRSTVTIKAIKPDTLKGDFPLPVLTDKPLVVNVNSGGVKLKLSITKNKVKYHVIPKDIGVIKKIENVKKEVKSNIQKTVKTHSVTVNKKKPWLQSTLIYIVVILIILAIMYWQIKPFKNVINKLLKLI